MLRLRYPTENALVLVRPDQVVAIEPTFGGWCWTPPGEKITDVTYYNGPICRLWLIGAANPIPVRGTVEELGTIVEKALSEGE